MTVKIIQWDVLDLPLPDESIDMIFSDPPYVKNQVITYKWLANESVRVLKPGKFIAVMCGGMALNKIMRWFDDTGLSFYWLYQLQLSAQGTGVVWKHGNTSVPITTRTKHILVYAKGARALARTATVGLYRAGKVDKRWHHWGQDVDSHRYYIDCFSAPGDLILDPMGGGGTSAVACVILNRRCIIGDLDRSAIDTMAYRMSGKTGESLSPLPLFNMPEVRE